MAHAKRGIRGSGRLAALGGALGLLVLALAITLPTEPAGAAEEGAASAAGDPWQAPEEVGEGAAEERVIGRVVGIRGRVYAQSPGQPRRLLSENAPIFPGDRLVTSSGAQLGVLSGEYYTGLNEDTTLTYAKQGSGAPVVKLERGDVRVINAGDGAGASIATPGMRAETAAADSSAYALEEKAWVVSMVCALEGQVQVRGQGSGQTLQVEEGGCALAKPAEGLFAGASPAAPLPVLEAANALPGVGAAGPAGGGAGAAGPAGAGGGGGAGAPAAAAGPAPPPAGNAANRFPGPDVAAPPGAAFALNPRPGLPGLETLANIVQPCDQAASGCVATLPVAPPPIVFPPLNGIVPGIQP